MSEQRHGRDDLPFDALAQIDRLADRFELAWSRGGRPRLEDLLGEIDEPYRRALAAELLAVELDARRRLGERPARDEYLARLPELAHALDRLMAASGASAPPTGRDGDAATALLAGLLSCRSGWAGRGNLLDSLFAWLAGEGRRMRGRGLDAEPAEGGMDLDSTVTGGFEGPGAVTFGLGPSPEGGPRYRVLRPHAKGGLGAIFVAMDRDLHREVALKEIQDRFADDPVSRSRFLQEAEITGALEHPGIVPVYGLGCNDDGRPYYAMRLIRGDSLKQAIETFHAGAALESDRGSRSLELRKLLRRFLDVCNAIDYAHSRGVLHRDIKPANIIVGKHGETVVIDWGLAKLVGQPESLDDTDEEPLDPPSARGGARTIHGSSMGTPGFMSPEQARGELNRLGPRSDIYSLGATLHCLLSGELPPDEERGVCNPARGRDRPPEPALEAICLKAMATAPECRYESCRALADDLERWMADEPVSVYREPFSTRITRWGRRNGMVASALGAILITTVLALALSTALISREQARTEQQRRQALASYAEARQQQGLAAVLAGEAREKARALQRQLYVNRISLADRDSLEDVGAARRLLAECLPGDRGWEWSYLDRLCHLDRRTLVGHESSVNCVAFSPDGKTIVSGGGKTLASPRATDPAELIIWEAASGRVIHNLTGIQGNVNSVAISGDGRRLLVASGFSDKAPGGGGHVQLREMATAALLMDEPIRDLQPMVVAFSPDGRLMAAGLGIPSSDLVAGRFVIWEVATGVRLVDEAASVGGVMSLAFSPDSRQVALGCKSVTELWKIRPAARIREIRAHGGWVFGLAYSPDGETLATTGWDGTVRLWDARSGSPLQVLDGHRGWVSDVKFSPDGDRLATCGSDHTVRVWDRRLARELLTLRGHSSHVHEVSFSPDGKQIASAGEDRTIKLWDATSDGRVVYREHGRWVTCAAFSPDGRRLATSDGGGVVEVWDPLVGRRMLRLEGHNGWVSGLAFSPDGTILASTGEYGELHLWSGRTGELIRRIKGLDAFARGVAFSGDGRLLAACTGVHEAMDNAPGSVYVWKVSGGSPIRRFRGHAGRVLALAFFSDGERIASLCEAGPERSGGGFELMIWEVSSAKVLRRWSGSGTAMRTLALSRDENSLAAGGDDGNVRIWDVGRGDEIDVLAAASKPITALAFSPDDRRLAIGSYERTIKIWALDCGETVLSLSGHTEAITALAFSRDGGRLASGSIDTTCRVWDGTEPGAGKGGATSCGDSASRRSP